LPGQPLRILWSGCQARDVRINVSSFDEQCYPIDLEFFCGFKFFCGFEHFDGQEFLIFSSLEHFDYPEFIILCGPKYIYIPDFCNLNILLVERTFSNSWDKTDRCRIHLPRGKSKKSLKIVLVFEMFHPTMGPGTHPERDFGLILLPSALQILR
jgi:hypothetical protein